MDDTRTVESQQPVDDDRVRRKRRHPLFHLGEREVVEGPDGDAVGIGPKFAPHFLEPEFSEGGTGDQDDVARMREQPKDVLGLTREIDSDRGPRGERVLRSASL